MPPRKPKHACGTGIRCDGVRRRDFLQVGALAGFGLTLGDWFRLRAGNAVPGEPRARSCILVWLDGGPTHLDTFDPKPDAPREIRGPFETIPTAVPGVRFSEHLPQLARDLGRFTLIRSLTHELGNHDTGSRYLLTGHRPTTSVDYPSLGSITARELGGEGPLPPYIAIPDAGEAAQAGYLSARFSPFSVGGDPSRPDYRVTDLDLPKGVDTARAGRRRSILETVDAFGRRFDHSGARDAFYEQAYSLMLSEDARSAFDPRHEPAPLRERYGRSRIGSGCLLARRLVERGARFVSVVDRGWDTHQDLARELPDSRFPGSGKLPSLDRAVAALVADLEDRGLLDSTLVAVLGEFGRTPKLNSRGGRDHWPRAGFALLAGGGVARGRVIGATDAFGETPSDQPVRPEDLAFSVLSLLGIDPATEYHTPSGRPLRILAEGAWIPGLA